MEGERQSLLQQQASTVEEARVRNRRRRLKLHSKRLRQRWPRIALFLAPRDVVALSSTCRRLRRLVDTDRIWKIQYERVQQHQVTKLVAPHVAMRLETTSLPMKEKLRRVMRARQVHDPTNALQLRLRQAEREVFRVELLQRKMRNLVWMNVPLVLVLCCLSVWSYTRAAEAEDAVSSARAAQLRGAHPGSSPLVHGKDSVAEFVLITDLLLLVAVMIWSVGDLVGKTMYTVGVLLAIETILMLAELVAWSSLLPLAHAFLVLIILLLNGSRVAKEMKDYARELAAFSPSN